MVGTLVCAVILFFAHDSIAVLWIFSVALAFFTGPIRPSAFAWANRYIDVTSMAQIVPQIGASLGDIAFLVGVGFSYEQHGPYVLWSYQLGLAVGICIVSWVLQTIGSLHGDRFRDPDKLSQWWQSIFWTRTRAGSKYRFYSKTALNQQRRHSVHSWRVDNMGLQLFYCANTQSILCLSVPLSVSSEENWLGEKTFR